MTNAATWAWAREQWLDLVQGGKVTVNELVAQTLTGIMAQNAPRSIPEPNKHGDMGWVTFPDGSEITWDWDEGHFYLKDQNLTYPWAAQDPLFWTDYPVLNVVPQFKL